MGSSTELWKIYWMGEHMPWAVSDLPSRERSSTSMKCPCWSKRGSIIIRSYSEVYKSRLPFWLQSILPQTHKNHVLTTKKKNIVFGLPWL